MVQPVLLPLSELHRIAHLLGYCRIRHRVRQPSSQSLPLLAVTADRGSATALPTLSTITLQRKETTMTEEMMSLDEVSGRPDRRLGHPNRPLADTGVLKGIWFSGRSSISMNALYWKGNRHEESL